MKGVLIVREVAPEAESAVYGACACRKDENSALVLTDQAGYECGRLLFQWIHGKTRLLRAFQAGWQDLQEKGIVGIVCLDPGKVGMWCEQRKCRVYFDVEGQPFYVQQLG